MTDPPSPANADTLPAPPDGAIYGSVEIPDDYWGVDCSMLGGFTDAQIDALWSQPQPNKALPRVVAGYVPLPGNVSRWDMTEKSARAYCDRGFVVVLVQHPRSGLWVASEAQGRGDAKHAADYVAGWYPIDAHLSMDDEAVKNAGPEVFASVTGWADEMKRAAAPCVYEGFCPGLSPAKEYAIPDVDRYWGAYGPWDVDVRGVCCRQSLQVVLTHTGPLAGIPFDPDHYFADKLGGRMRGMARLDLWKP